jgi:hypothetical protein
MPFASFLQAVARLPAGALWRHNQAGDLQGTNDRIDSKALSALARANRGRRGFTYTHYPVEGAGAREKANRRAIARANASGFTINLSADSLAEADRLANLAVGPVVVILPSNQKVATKTPNGRAVAICPAVLAPGVTCATCGVCALRDRAAIIGFPAHGISAKRVSAISLTPGAGRFAPTSPKRKGASP